MVTASDRRETTSVRRENSLKLPEIGWDRPAPARGRTGTGKTGQSATGQFPMIPFTSRPCKTGKTLHLSASFAEICAATL
jgi:hypothetical protein